MVRLLGLASECFADDVLVAARKIRMPNSAFGVYYEPLLLLSFRYRLSTANLVRASE